MRKGMEAIRPLREKYFVFRGNTQGVAAIEFAIVANIFLLLLAGISGFGVYMSASHSLQQISAEAARTSIRGVTISEQASFANAYISQQGGDYPFLEGGLVTASVTHPTSSSIKVTVSYDTANLPVLNLLTGLDMPGGTISASSTVRIGSKEGA